MNMEIKNYLTSLKHSLIKNKTAYIPEKEPKEIKNIANLLEVDFSLHNLKKIPTQHSANYFNINRDNMVYFYPINDGMPTCPFKFYKEGKIVLHNQKNYIEITNLDEILLQIVGIFDKSLDNSIVIDPYYFMLKLNDEVKENYKGSATLVITEKAIRNQKLNSKNFDEANRYFINHFLDHFMGWNFGVSINRNEKLKEELETLNKKVIDIGIREYAGSGFEVYGIDSEAYNGLQHYYLAVQIKNIKVK